MKFRIGYKLKVILVYIHTQIYAHNDNLWSLKKDQIELN